MNPEKSTLDELRIDRSAPARKVPFLAVGIVLAVLICLAAGIAWWIQRPKAARVSTFTVQEASSSGGQKTLLNASGYVTARRESTVSSKVTGKVIEVLIEEGMRVTQGQELARLDASNVKVSLTLSEAQLDAAKSALGETEASLAQAEKEFKRISELAKNRIASDADLDRSQSDMKVLRARLDRQTVEVAVAERQVALWQQQMDDTIIRAPFPGIVVSKNAQPGEMISPMSAGGFTRTGICTITDMDSLEIEIDVNESYINRVEAGQRVVATLDAYSDWKIPSKVIAIIPTADRQKATVKVRVGFDNLDPRILPQMGVKVAFQSTGEGPGASGNIVVPKAAVRKRDGRDVVWVVRDGRVERRAVTVGASHGDEVTIAAGLSGGDKVVVEGFDNLADGGKVTETNR